jgi:hypothetical protein
LPLFKSANTQLSSAKPSIGFVGHNQVFAEKAIIVFLNYASFGKNQPK